MPEDAVDMSTLSTEEFLDERSKALKNSKIRSFDVSFTDDGAFIIKVFKEGPTGEFISPQTLIGKNAEEVIEHFKSSIKKE